MLIYGKQGAGKTTLAASAVDVPQMNDVLMIDAERGDLVIQDNPRIRNHDKVKRIETTTFLQVGRVQEFLKAHCVHRDANNVQKLKDNQAWLTGVSAAEIEEPWRFKTVIIDTLTEIEMYNMYSLMGIAQDALLMGAKDDIDVAGWDEFRKNNMMVQILCRVFRDLPMHVIFTCHQTYTQDEMKRYHYNVSLTGKLANQVQGLVDIVGYLQRQDTPDEKGNQPTRLNVQPTGRFAAKNRRASFKEPHIDDPTMASILKAVGLLGA